MRRFLAFGILAFSILVFGFLAFDFLAFRRILRHHEAARLAYAVHTEYRLLSFSLINQANRELMSTTLQRKHADSSLIRTCAHFIQSVDAHFIPSVVLWVKTRLLSRTVPNLLRLL